MCKSLTCTQYLPVAPVPRCVLPDANMLAQCPALAIQASCSTMYEHSCTAAIEEPVSIRPEPRPELVGLQRHAWAYLLQPVCKHGMGRSADIIAAYHCSGGIGAAGCEHHGQILRQALPIRLVRLDSARKLTRVTAR